MIKSRRAALFGEALNEGRPAAEAGAIADARLRKHYRAEIADFSADYPIHSRTAKRIAAEHIEGF